MNTFLAISSVFVLFGIISVLYAVVMFAIYRLTGGKHSFLWYIGKI